MQQYDKINVIVNDCYLMANSLSLSQSSEQIPIYSLNKKYPIDYTPQTVRNTLSMEYYIEPSNDPNYSIISGWKSNPTGVTSAVLNIGENTVTGYLSNYSFTVSPLQTPMAQVTYEIYNLITGDIQNRKSPSDQILYNLQSGSGVSNYFRVFLDSGNTHILDSSILQFDFNFKSDIVPIYSINNVFPAQVYVSAASENLNVISELQKNPRFSGQSFISIFTGIDSIKIRNITNNSELTFIVSGMMMQSAKNDISVENIILFNLSFSQSY